MPLIIDYKVDKIIKEISAELLKEYGKIVPYEIIVKIIEQQCISTIKGMAKGDTIVWKYFGTYVATKKRVDSLNKRYEKHGKPITLEDHGLMRMSFTKKGVLTNEGEFVGQSKHDSDTQRTYIDKHNGDIQN